MRSCACQHRNGRSRHRRIQLTHEAVRSAWIWMLAGMASFWILGTTRPVIVGLFGIVLLTFLPLSGLTNLVTVANGLLAGWVILGGGSQLWRALIAFTHAVGPRALPGS